MLTFLEVGFGGNLVQGFRAYAWRAVPSFLQIALWGPSLAFWPQPLQDARFFLRIASSRYKVHVINQISQLEKVERYQPCNAKVKKILCLWIVVQKVVPRFYNASQRQKNIMLLCIVVLNVVLKFYHAPQGKEESRMVDHLLNAKIHIMNINIRLKKVNRY